MIQKNKNKQYLGNFISTYIGHSTDDNIRNLSSSGGIITSILIQAIKRDDIDEILHVGYDKKQPWNPKLVISKNEKGIIGNIGSKYVKILTQDVIKQIPNDKNVVVVGHPCVMASLNKLRKTRFTNIKLLVGFFCGWPMIIEGTDYLINKLNVKKKDIKSIDYRGGPYPGGFSVKIKDGQEFNLKKHHYDLPNVMFNPKTCDKCIFYTAESADISVGDCWINGKKGYSSIITRTSIGEKILKECKSEKFVKIQKIDPEIIIKTHWHNIRYKKFKKSILIRLIKSIFRNKIIRKITPFKVIGLLAKLRRQIKK